MFPVKGLSVSAEKLKVEMERPAGTAASVPKTSRKRKRQGNTENVTAANFADLWEKVIEHKGPSVPADKAQPKKDHKRQKREHESTAPSNAAVGTASPAQLGSKGQHKQVNDSSEKKQRKKEKEKQKQASLIAASEPAEKEEWNGIDDEGEAEEAPEAAQPVVNGKAEKKKKKKKKQKQSTGDDSQGTGQHQQAIDKTPTAEAAPPPAPPAPAPAKLTPLQASMREKLISARFRHLNETLYTRPSTEAFQLFQDSPEMFTEYHEGFRRQVDVWPENPVDGYIADIKSRAKVRFPPRNRNQPLTPSQLPLPKPPGSKTCTIADLGCGDAKLATALQPLQSKLHLDICSFDLQTGGSPLVTRADIANLPLPDGSVDVAIFCLALMGTNWIDFIEEAYRVLRWKGELWVAEIKSRFTNPELNKKKVVAHSVGNRKKGAAASKGKKGDEEDEAELAAELAVQVDGVAKQQQETDISGFVEALRKRGFLLNRDLGENAVDMRNKMFVRMHFVKAAPAVKGKCAVEDKGQGQGQGQGHGSKGKKEQAGPKKKFFGDGEDEVVNEAAVLKPCVYKVR